MTKPIECRDLTNASFHNTGTDLRVVLSEYNLERLVHVSTELFDYLFLWYSVITSQPIECTSELQAG